MKRRDGTGERSWLAGGTRRLLAAALPLGVVVAVLAVFVPGVPHYDVGVFLDAGTSISHGRNPYPVGAAQVASGFAFVYPYLVALPFAPLSALGAAAAPLFILASALAVVAGCAWAGAGPRGTALVLLSSFTITGLQMGTLNALLFAGLIALWRARDRPLAAGLLVAAVIYSKLFLAPVWLFLVLTRRWRAAGIALATLAVAFAVGGLLGPIGPADYVSMLGTLARAEAPDGMSLTGLLVNTGLGPAAATWLARAAALAALAAVAWPGLPAARRDRGSRPFSRPLRASGRADERVQFAAVIGASLLASPIVWSHYLILLSAALLVVAPRADAALAVFALASWPVVNPHHIHPLGALVGLGLLGALAARPLGALGRRIAARPRRAALSLVVTVLAAAAVAGITLAGLVVESAGRPGGARVAGAYCAQVALVACLVWAVRNREGAHVQRLG